MADRSVREFSTQAPAGYIGDFLQGGIFPYAQGFLQDQFQNLGTPVGIAGPESFGIGRDPVTCSTICCFILFFDAFSVFNKFIVILIVLACFFARNLR